MTPSSSRWIARHALRAIVAGAASAALSAAAPTPAFAQQFDCSSPDPSKWPPPAKPYFMVGFDTSGSMTTTIYQNGVPLTDSCGYGTSRLSHGRCALKNTILAFSGQANFGLASYARRMVNCNGATCYNGCGAQNLPNNSPGDPGNPNNGPGATCDTGCGAEPDPTAPFSATRAGANILVPMLQDTSPPQPSNVPQLVQWVDNNCSGSTEIFASGCTPLNGLLRDMYRYYANQWTYPGGGTTYTSPLTSAAAGERACRSVNVILVTDGGETCDGINDPVNAAAALFGGFTKDGITWRVKTFVIDFGDAGSAADQIAMAGGTQSARTATNENELSIALADIIRTAASPEVCDNVDNNCNGCIDEGYKHYCDVQPVAGNCCTLARDTCLTNYRASITPANPGGNLQLLPCTTPAQAQNSATWLCYDPGERCDNVDNNCQADANGVSVDEGVVKCGNPLHCPQPETCNGLDDNCNGQVDEGVCNGCVPSAEVCDGCDNDCDGIADNGIAPIPCGLASPPNCTGTLSCNPPQPVPIGGCAPGGGYGTCSNHPQAEVCDGIDNNCNGQIDDGIPPTNCVPPGTPPNLHYGGTSQCRMGQQPCNGTCQGFVGPSPEVCDGIDNDCDGVVDNGAFGVGLPCGINQPPCTPGTTACVNGALVCQGGTGPRPEVCDGVDNNCNGQIDEAPLADSPPAAQNGCWTNSGTCCRWPPAPAMPFASWCPPAGATCAGNGTLTPPCNRGTLTCVGGAWTCTNSKGPGTETCDGIDNNCDGQVDNGLGSPVGDTCGSNVGECHTGTIVCNAGMLTCSGATGPTQEICDGKDNDCDGVIDNGLQAGGPCTPPYNTMDYPGPRNHYPCAPGVYRCDANGNLVCVGGVAPSPEICDGIDNDCDGQVDEAGPPPDGLDGTVNPHPPPTAAIGDMCGDNQGQCKQGTYACLHGVFACIGNTTAQPEQCDCLDNNCDGQVDNQTPNGPPLCTPGKSCIKSGDQCQCAAPCSNGEFPCPPGQKCEQVTESGTGKPLGSYCVTDFDAVCGDCSTKVVKDANGQVICGPAGTVGDNCVPVPICACKQQNGCREPCFGVTCPTGQTCTNYGPNAGKCTSTNNCWQFPCVGCDQACHGGACVHNPCTDKSCPTGQECKPSADFTSFTCVPSCAGVTCPSGQTCVDGACKPTCDPPCMNGQACDTTQNPPACVQNMCNCADGSCCTDPAKGTCGDCPCTGVVCPSGQECKDGSCFGPGGAGGGTSSSSSSSTGSGTSGAGTGGAASGVWGLATGGGGCACEAGAGAPSTNSYRWALVALAIGWLRRKRRADGSPPRRGGSGAPQNERDEEVAR